MLKARQKQIFLIMDENKDFFVKGTYISDKLNCSTKTIQKEIKELKNIISEYDIEMKSVTSKGYKLIIHDIRKYENFKINMLNVEKNEDFNNQSFRITYILTELLITDKYVKSDYLADKMYICRSSVSSDIKIVKKILEKYELKIEYRPNYGMKVIGTEKDKRECIAKEQLELYKEKSQIKKERISTVSDIVIKNLMKSKYRISDVVLQNLVLHICVSIKRMQCGIYIENSNYIQNCADEKNIAKNILSELSSTYNFEVRNSEIEFLAIHLLGKRSYEKEVMINSETDKFVNDMLSYIKLKTNIDFYGDIELKISLALHIIPLFIRLENKIQLKNSMIQDIKSNYPLAYDVAVIAASYINEKKYFILNEDEVGYLAVHFSLSLSKKENKINPKKVLIICNARRGDCLMLQSTFLREFNQMISELEIINAFEISSYCLDDYDCIFTTFLNHPLIPSRALRINFFIDQRDIQRIKKALLGKRQSKELLKYFKNEYFMGGVDAENREEIIKKMCVKAELYTNFDEDLYDACMRREELGGTCYGQLIALPHPESLISQKTIVITALLRNPIPWSEQKAQLVFLICAQKGSKNDLSVLFECISKFMMDGKSVQDVIDKCDYLTFIRSLEKLID
ncbi:PRD domain-containing protein [Clostridium paraputrificum]|uniref:Putative licABCH operon regulator n=1 Tax=Clostridium paraputrificum TaxID=29363 RepID=A0A6N3CGB3_9CLOT|nr:PRD domain-containing protein [Clostridium sp.]MBS5987898.1 PRD domain-containing protein [Clostridium sp.]